MDLSSANNSNNDSTKTDQAATKDESGASIAPAQASVPTNSITPAPPVPPATTPPPPVTPAPVTNDPTDTNVPINTATPQTNEVKSDIGVGSPNIGVEPEEPTTGPTPASNTPTPIAPEPNLPVAPAAPTPAEGAVAVPINKYSSNVIAEETPAPVAPKQAEPTQPPFAAAPLPNVAKPPVKASSATGLIAVLAFFALVVGGAGGFVGFKELNKVTSSADTLGATSTSTASTFTSPTTSVKNKEYTSTKYSFSLQYPSDWFASTADTQADSIVFASNQESLEGTPTGYKTAIDFQTNDGKTLKAWVDAYKVSSGESADATQITVSSAAAYQQQLTKNGTAIATYVPLADKIMIITYSAPTDKFTDGEDIYNKIITSIKVTE